MIASLQRGYRHFVLLHTIHTLLIHISSLITPFNIDPTAKMITKLFFDNFLNAEKTESTKANEHKNSSYKPSDIREAKTNKTLRQQLSSNNGSRQISNSETFGNGRVRWLTTEHSVFFRLFVSVILDVRRMLKLTEMERRKKGECSVEEVLKEHI